jgi:hypothetical protein
MAGDPHMRRTEGDDVALVRRRGGTAQKSAENHGICGKKDTGGVPQRGTGI